MTKALPSTPLLSFLLSSFLSLSFAAHFEGQLDRWMGLLIDTALVGFGLENFPFEDVLSMWWSGAMNT